ncbi:hypothetical protein M404DRAFT_1000773, partial [Pisolithus tinctorius Marx 270]
TNFMCQPGSGPSIYFLLPSVATARGSGPHAAGVVVDKRVVGSPWRAAQALVRGPPLLPTASHPGPDI